MKSNSNKRYNCVLLVVNRNYLFSTKFITWQLNKEKNRTFDIVIASKGLNKTDLPTGSDVYLEISTSDFVKGLPTNERLSEYTYWRIPAIELASQSYEKVLYLDTDVYINTKAISDIFKIPLETFAIAACRDVHQWYKKARAVPEFSNSVKKNSPYFNAGVLLINSRVWQKENVYCKIKEVIQISKNWPRHDQSILNNVFYEKWLEISVLWNWQLSLKNSLWVRHFKPFIIHLAGSEKIWSEKSDVIPNEFTHVYQEFITEQNNQTLMTIPTKQKKFSGLRLKMILKNLYYAPAIINLLRAVK